MVPVEIVWEKILSRDAEQIKETFSSLDIASQANVLAHLRVICEEEGWHPEQKISAQTALDTIESEDKA
jgi:hypothetical protein